MLKKWLILTIFVLCVVYQGFALLSLPTLNIPADKSKMAPTNPYLIASGSTGTLYLEFEYAENASFSNAVRVKSIYYSGSGYTYCKPLDFNTTIYWRARCVSKTDSSKWSNAFSFTTDTNITITGPTKGGAFTPGIYFGWYKNARFSEYVYEFDTIPSFDSKRLISTRVKDTFSYFAEIWDKRLSYGDTFYWRLRGINTTDSMKWLPYIKFWTMDSVNLTGPADGVTVKTNTKIEWVYGPHVNYQVEIDTSTSFNTFKRRFFNIDGSQADNQTLRELEFDQTYYWHVRGCTGTDTSRWTLPRKFNVVGMKNQNALYNVTLQPATTFYCNIVDSATAYQFQIDTVPGFNSPWLKDSVRNSVALTIPSLPFRSKIYQRVRPMHASDTGDWCNVKSGTVVKAFGAFPYANSIAVPVNSVFRCSNYDGVTGYRIQRDVHPLFNSPALFDTILPYYTGKLPLMSYNTTYHWRIKMMHAWDTSDWGLVSRFTTQSAPVLRSPYSFYTAGPGVAGQLDWDSMPGTTQFQVLYDTVPNFKSKAVQSVWVPGDSSYLNIKDLFFGKLYYWKVRAIHGSDTSIWSDAWYFYTYEKPALDWPANRQADITFSSLDWRSINGTTGYQYMLSKDTLFSDPLEGTVALNNAFFHYFDPNPTQFNSSYFWKVRVFHSKDTSLWSDVWKFTTRARSGVKLVSPANQQANVALGVQFSWNKVTDATQYIIAYSTNMDMSAAKYAAVSTNSYNASVAPSVTYFWKVIAKNKDGIHLTDTSVTWQFNTALNFGKPVLSLPADHSIRLPASITFSWVAIKGAEYDLQVSADTAFSNPSKFSVQANSQLINNMTANKTYYWRARAKNTYVNGPWSSYFTFSTDWKTGIEEMGVLLLKLYPNPANASVYIDITSSNASVALYNMMGEELSRKDHIDSGMFELDMRGFAAGNYIVVVENEQGRHSVPLVKY